MKMETPRKTKVVEDQTGRRIFDLGGKGFVQNSGSTWDRLCAAQPGTLFAWDDDRKLWVEVSVEPVKGGKTMDWSDYGG